MKLTIRCRAPAYLPAYLYHTNPYNSLVDPGYQKPPFTVEVGAQDTIGLLKYQILETASIPIHEQEIIPNIAEEGPADDDRRLQACGLYDGHMVTVYRIPRPPEMPDDPFNPEEPFKIGLSLLLAGRAFPFFC